MRLVLAEPDVQVEVVALLRPQHPGQGLAHHGCRVVAHLGRGDRHVEVVGLGPALLDELVDAGQRVTAVPVASRPVDPGPVGLVGRDGADEPAAQHHLAAGRHHEAGVGGDLRALCGGVDRALRPGHDVVVDPVLRVGRRALRAPQPLAVALVLAEQEVGRALDVERVLAEGLVLREHRRVIAVEPAQAGARAVRWPGPGVAEPQRRQQVERRVLRAPVGDGDAEGEVQRTGLGVLDLDVEVPAVVEDAGVEQLVLLLAPGPGAVRVHQVLVGVGLLRVLVEPALVGVRRHVVEVEVVLLHVLAVVALASWSGRTAAPSGWRPARSTARWRSTAAAGRRTGPPARPRPSGRRASAPRRG